MISQLIINCDISRFHEIWYDVLWNKIYLMKFTLKSMMFWGLPLVHIQHHIQEELVEQLISNCWDDHPMMRGFVPVCGIFLCLDSVVLEVEQAASMKSRLGWAACMQSLNSQTLWSSPRSICSREQLSCIEHSMINLHQRAAEQYQAVKSALNGKEIQLEIQSLYQAKFKLWSSRNGTQPQGEIQWRCSRALQHSCNTAFFAYWEDGKNFCWLVSPFSCKSLCSKRL